MPYMYFEISADQVHRSSRLTCHSRNYFQIDRQRTLMADLDSELGQRKRDLQTSTGNVERLEGEAVGLREEGARLARHREDLRRSCEQLKLERGHLLRERQALLHHRTVSNEAVASAESELAKSKASRNQIAGIKSVEKIVQYLVR